MGKREDKLIVEFDNDFIESLIEWKKLCNWIYGFGGIKQRAKKIIEMDLKKLREEDLNKSKGLK